MKLFVRIVLIPLGFLIGWNLAEAFKANASAQSRVMWTSQCYTTYDEMIRGAAGRENVQFFSVPSERNYLGILGSPYCIIYKK